MTWSAKIGLPLAAACLLGACAIEQKAEFGGKLPTARGEGMPVALDLAVFHHSGKPFPEDGLAYRQYRRLAEDGLRQAGYRLDEDADLALSIEVRDAGAKGLLRSDAEIARNLGVSVATLGFGCDKWRHSVSASVQGTAQRAAGTGAAQHQGLIDRLRAAQTPPCFRRARP